MDYHIDKLIGKKFEHGFQDCYTLIRDFYTLNCDFTLPNYARPTDWWNAGMNMYMERYFKHGFRSLDCHPSEYKPGDLVFMAIQSEQANHAGILLPEGQIIHHLYNRISLVEAYRGLTRNTTVAILRNPSLKFEIRQETIEILDVLPASVRRRAENVLQAT